MTLYVRCYRLWVHHGEPCAPLLRFVRYRVLGKWWSTRLPNAGIVQEAIQEAIEDAVTIRDVAVIIPCHNYARFLAEAIESVLAQTMRPSDILVLDDASTDDPAAVVARYADWGVRLVRVEERNLARTRNVGARLTQSAYLLYLDADDQLAPHFIERCLEVMEDPNIAVAYADLHYFDERNGYIRAPEFQADTLLRSNYIASNALIRRQGFDVVGGYRDIPHCLEDWDLYRRLVQAGFPARRANTFLRYRYHSDSMVHVHNRSAQKNYCNDAALLHTPITIFTPFAGRESVFARYVEGLRNLENDPANVHLHWYNTSPDPAFAELLRSTMATLPFVCVTYAEAPLPAQWSHTPESLIQKRIKNADDADYYYQMAVVRAYNEAVRTCDTEYLLTVEDDMALNPDTLTRLLQSVQWDTAAVIAPYRSGFFPRYEVWMANPDGTVRNFKEKESGIREVGGCGFGCTLFRISDLRAIGPIRTGVRSQPMQWYDQITYLRLRSYGKILCNWDTEVEHMTTERHTEGLAKHFT